MSFLLDTSILMRLANLSDPAHAIAARTVVELHRRGEVLHIAPQVLIEFRSAATRPKAVNGAGLPAADADAHAVIFETRFLLLEETPDIFPAWKAIVTALGVIGKQVHDARRLAVCQVHGITHLLTFNVGHFGRLAAIGASPVVVDPATV